MVIVIEKTKEQEKSEEEYDRLEKIAMETFAGSKTLNDLKPIAISICKEEKIIAMVHVDERIILNISKESYDEVFSLAQKYEKQTNSEWTLRKDYSE